MEALKHAQTLKQCTIFGWVNFTQNHVHPKKKLAHLGAFQFFDLDRLEENQSQRVASIISTPLKINGWNIIMEVWKIIFLYKWVICRFHLNLPGCSWWFFAIHLKNILVKLDHETTKNKGYKILKNLRSFTI